MEPEKEIKMNKKSGFTLVEVLVSAAILITAIGAIFYASAKGLESLEINRNYTTALYAAQTRLEEIRQRVDPDAPDQRVGFILIDDQYHNTSFNVLDINGNVLTNFMGVTYVDTISADLSGNPLVFEVTAVVCWQGQAGRIYGNDTDLDGDPDDGQARVDSPCRLTTAVAQM